MADTTFLIDNYVTTKPGEAIRLFPFGEVVKNGKKRTITKEYAQRFKLPPWKPPVKLGSHREDTPAGGHFVRLEVRDDGLYGIPEITDKGQAAIDGGDYRYHSPEVIWDDGAIEDSQTGELIPGPFIVGTALLHSPHLGQRAALYTVQPLEVNMSEQTVSMPANLFEQFMSFLGRDNKQAPEPTPPVVETNDAPGVDADEFAALQAKAAQADEYAAQIAAYEAKEAHAARVEHFTAELASTPVKDNADVLSVLARLDDETAAPIVQQFKALSEQAGMANLDQPVGGTGEGLDGNPLVVFDAMVKQHAKDNNVSYDNAAVAVANAHPDMYRAAMNGKGR